MPTFKFVVRRFLEYADRNGVRRQHEVLPKWVKQNYPKVYESIPELAELEGILHKNDLAYRVLPADKKAEVKRQRSLIYGRVSARLDPKLKCPTCGADIKHNFESRVPVPLRIVNKVEQHCSVRCMANDPKLKARKAKTNLERYGSICSLNGEEQRKAKLKTWRKNFGASNPSQSPEVVSKILQARYGRKTVVLGGKEFVFQGYEGVAIAHLVKIGVPVSRIATSAKKVGMFAYTFEGRKLRYLPDIKFKSKSGKTWYVEVKSILTLNSSRSVRDRMLAKAKAMWETHKKNYRVVLCSSNHILGTATDLESLRTLCKEHQQW